MKIAIRYFSRGGNTKKLAEAIGEELDVPAETVDKPLEEDTDILFLGSAIYAYGVDEHVRKFISDNIKKIGVVYNFSTTAIVKSTYSHIEKLLKLRGITLAEEEYACKGEFGPLHKGKPGDKEIKAVKTFARKAVEANSVTL